jgi:hypothetical protein
MYSFIKTYSNNIKNIVFQTEPHAHAAGGLPIQLLKRPVVYFEKMQKEESKEKVVR